MNILMLCLISILFVVPSAGATSQEKTTYTNEDIEKYRNPSDDYNAQSTDRKYERRRDVRQVSDRREQEYWCGKGSALAKKIEAGKKEMSDLNEDMKAADRTKDEQKGRKLQVKLKKLKTKLASDERDLGDLENRAHRKGVPAGWLRCQFD